MKTKQVIRKSNHRRTSGWRSVIASIILLAVMDLKSENEKVVKKAMSFLKSETCEWYCSVIGFNYELMKDLSLDNIHEVVNFFALDDNIITDDNDNDNDYA